MQDGVRCGVVCGTCYHACVLARACVRACIPQARPPATPAPTSSLRPLPWPQERSSVYERLVEVEDLAKQAKRGLHSAKEPPPNRINDVSQPGNAAK